MLVCHNLSTSRLGPARRSRWAVFCQHLFGHLGGEHFWISSDFLSTKKSIFIRHLLKACLKLPLKKLKMLFFLEDWSGSWMLKSKDRSSRNKTSVRRNCDGCPSLCASRYPLLEASSKSGSGQPQTRTQATYFSERWKPPSVTPRSVVDWHTAECFPRKVLPKLLRWKSWSDEAN